MWSTFPCIGLSVMMGPYVASKGHLDLMSNLRRAVGVRPHRNTLLANTGEGTFSISYSNFIVLRVVFIDLGIGTSVLTFIPVSPLLDHK